MRVQCTRRTAAHGIKQLTARMPSTRAKRLLQSFYIIIADLSSKSLTHATYLYPTPYSLLFQQPSSLPLYPLIPKLCLSASPSLLIASSTASFGAAANVVRRYNSLSVPFSARNQLPRDTRTEWSTAVRKMDSSREIRVSGDNGVCFGCEYREGCDSGLIFIQCC